MEKVTCSDWGLISMANILWLWWSQHLNPELSSYTGEWCPLTAAAQSSWVMWIKALPGDSGSLSKGQIDWHTLPDCSCISVVIYCKKKWELPLGCSYNALGALHWQVSLYPIWSRWRSPIAALVKFPLHIIPTGTIYWTISAKFNFPNAHWGSSAGSGPSRAKWHISEYKWFSTNPSLTKLCERAVAVTETYI